MDAPSAWLAALPIFTVLGAMLLLRWSAARAGIAGALLCAALAPAFGADRLTLAGALAEAAFTSATILWILWPALALHEHQQQSGALDRLRQSLAGLSSRGSLQVIVVGWFAALFFEGAAGFGTPVALAAPLLVGLGVAPAAAVVLALLGHAVGVSFGALGTPVLAQLALVEGLDVRALSGLTALLHLAAGGVMAFAFHRVLASSGTAGGGTDAARRPARADGAWMAFAAVAFLVPSVLLAALLGPELATLGAALAGGLLFVGAVRWAAPAGASPAGGIRLVQAFAPYIVLVALVLLTRGIEPIAQALGRAALEWTWMDRFGGRFVALAHPGTLLFVALLAGATLQGVSPMRLRRPFILAAQRLLPVSAALLAMLFLSRLMVHSGMIDAIRAAAVAGLGGAWPLVAPAVGALGSFVTGSATASNVLFTTLQAQTAQSLGLPVSALLAAQGFGAAMGNIVCPHNIVAGAATVGLAGREPEILRRTLLPCAAALFVGGLALWLALAWAGA